MKHGLRRHQSICLGIIKETIAGAWGTDKGKVGWCSWQEDNGLEKYLEGKLVKLDNGLCKVGKGRIR